MEKSKQMIGDKKRYLINCNRLSIYTHTNVIRTRNVSSNKGSESERNIPRSVRAAMEEGDRSSEEEAKGRNGFVEMTQLLRKKGEVFERKKLLPFFFFLFVAMEEEEDRFLYFKKEKSK